MVVGTVTRLPRVSLIKAKVCLEESYGSGREAVQSSIGRTY